MTTGPGTGRHDLRTYYEATNNRWREAGVFSTREKADTMAHDLRVAGCEARVTAVVS